MDVTIFAVIEANSFTNAAFLVARLATTVLLAAVEVAKLEIASMISMCSSSWVGIGAGATWKPASAGVISLDFPVLLKGTDEVQF